MTHTTGPWTLHIGDDYVRIYKEGLHIDEDICEINKWDLQTEDNGRLIAAAPELLEALKALKKAVANEVIFRGAGCNAEYLKAENKANVAIDKAEGRL